MRHSPPSTRHRTRVLLAALLLALLPAWAAPSCAGPPPPPPATAPRVDTAQALTEHVVVISIDGLRPDAAARAGAPTLQRLMREGSYSLRARTVLPSKTLPSHTSMVTGVGPEVHGITWNGDLTALRGRVRVPTMFGVARRAGLTTAAFFGKSKLHHLEVPGTLDHASSPWGWWGSWPAERTAAEVEEVLPRLRPNLAFVHFGEPDLAGHEYGWLTPEYAAAVRAADRAVARVLASADRAYGEDGYTVIVTADHGGEGLEHGLDTPAHRTIPWIAWGRGVAPRGPLATSIDTVDTAATALWLLGVPVPEGWEGRPVEEAFQRDT